MVNLNSKRDHDSLDEHKFLCNGWYKICSSITHILIRMNTSFFYQIDFYKQQGSRWGWTKPGQIDRQLHVRKPTFEGISITLPKSNIAPEKLPKPNRKVVFQPPFFRGYVKLRRCKSIRKPLQFVQAKISTEGFSGQIGWVGKICCFEKPLRSPIPA